ncbi:MAG: hypothetical protein ACREQI_11240 [Candidatus Binataceae bacterium]
MAPSATISFSNSQFLSYTLPTGIAVDSSGNIDVAANSFVCAEAFCNGRYFGCDGSASYFAGSISVYSPGSYALKSNFAPSALNWTGSQLYGGTMSVPSIALDGSGNIYVPVSLQSGIAPNIFASEVLTFPAGSEGSQPPSATIVGSNTGLDYSLGVAIGPGTSSPLPTMAAASRAPSRERQSSDWR